jgi:hypothetical protein
LDPPYTIYNIYRNPLSVYERGREEKHASCTKEIAKGAEI